MEAPRPGGADGAGRNRRRDAGRPSKDILPEGARGGKRVSIHVEMFNPALALHERLGFRKLKEHGVYHFMEWAPESSA